ncbi:MAG: nucleotide exchange factor GrpE [Rhodospirillales bacterium]
MAKDKHGTDRPGKGAAEGAGDKVKTVAVADNAPGDAPGDAPEDAPADAPADTAGDAPEDTPADAAPTEDTPADAPQDTPGDAAPAEDTPAEAKDEGDRADAAAEAGPEAAADPAALEAEVAELNDKLLRALAEAENVRRRAERDKEDSQKYAIAGFAREMLGVADNLKRALDSLGGDDQEAGAETPDPEHVKTRFDRFVEGVHLTEAEMIKTFERIGIEKIEPAGQPFDPNLHEAMFEADDAEKPAGTVIQVLEPGYVLNDRLLRPAKVGVSKGGPKAADEPEKRPTPDTAPKEGRTAYEDKGKGPGAQLDEEL